MSDVFFSWRGAILKSTLPPTTRHVLLTLACHMNDAGESCYPSIHLLCAETGLSNRAVITHLHNSAELGWIKVRKQGLAGQAWSRNSYYLSWDHLKAVNVKTEAGEPNDAKAVKEVHTSTSLSTPYSTSIEHSEPETPVTPTGFTVFWQAFPSIRKGSKSKCEALWRKKKLESQAELIMKHLEFSKAEWAKEDYKYAPGALPYLNKEQWDGWEPISSKGSFEFVNK